MAKYSFAFDMGTNSIGGFVLRLDDKGNPTGLEHGLVRIFADGREPKSGNSLAEGRRAARAMARRRDRYKRRRKAVIRTLVEYGLMPVDAAARQLLLRETNDRSTKVASEAAPADVYNLRARALTEKLPLYHIGRALFHLNQRRGFKSNRKTDRKSNDKGAIEIGVDRLREKMDEANATTLGEFLAKRRAASEWVRVRGGAVEADGERDPSISDKAIYDFYPQRKLLEDEFNAIWEEQKHYYPQELTEDRRAHLFRVMFYQRPLKPAIVGKCSFPPHAETRLAKAHPLFQAFRLYKEVNELEVVLPDQTHRKLTLDERNALVLKLRGQRKATYATLRKTLKFPRDVRFNKETENRSDMLGDEVNAALSTKEAFGNRWSKFTMQEQWAIIERLREEEDPLALHEWLVAAHGLSDEAAGTAANIHLPEGYGRLGPTAISTMLEELKAEVIPEAEAARRAGYDHALARTDDGRPELPKYQEILERRIPPGTNDPNDPYDIANGRITNPTVHIALNQLQRVVNELIRRYGKPDHIAVELARDLKLNDKQKAEANRIIGENTRAAAKRSEKLRELGQKDNGYNRTLLRLWEELNPDKPEDRVCIYTGRPIGIRMLFSGEVDVDHILPWSKTLDDSQANRILCVVEANRVKGNRAPAEVTEWAGDYEAILDRANRLPRNKRWRFARDAMEAHQDQEGFLARQLTDTQYLSRLAHEYLDALYPAEEADQDGVLARHRHVRVIPGRLTEMLRRNWGLNSILPDHNFAGTTQPKNRKDNRHHAIDAAVVGVTTRSLLQRVATKAGAREAMALEETIADIDPPWPSFREDLKAIVEKIVVSHKPDHGTLPKSDAHGQTAGRLHNDTAYGITGELDSRGNTIVVRRKPFLSLTEKDISSIRDDELRSRLVSATSGLTGREFSAALDYFRKTDQKFRKVRHVRVIEPLAVIPIRDRTGRVFKGYKGDANFRYDVWELTDGKWTPEVVSMFDAHRPDWTSTVRNANPAARKVLSLKQNDMVAYDHPADGPTIGIVVKFSQSGQITLVPHQEGGDLKKRDTAADDPFKYYSPTAGGLKKIRLRQIRVDQIGRIFDPGPQDRDSRASRQNQLRN